jgi:hypothetical protein
MTHCLVNHHITGHLVFVLVSTEWVMMCPVIDNPTSCEICTVIHLLHAKNLNAAEIHHELCAVYSQNVMSDGTVRQWCRMFKDGQTNVHDEEKSGLPSVVNDDLVQSVDQKVCERWCFTISTNFMRCSLRGDHRFRARWVLWILIGAHKTERRSQVSCKMGFVNTHRCT